MSARKSTILASTVFVLLLAACGEVATLDEAAGYGPEPELPPPNETLVPTLNFVEAVGWPDGGKPEAADGLAVQAFARGLEHPRWLYTLPNGDVLVAESDAPAREEAGGIKWWIMKKIMRVSGSSHPSADRISLLRDADGDGQAELKTVFLKDLHSPFGMALIGEDFYVANTNAVLKFHYENGATQISGVGEKLVDLPATPPNGHWTKNILPDKRGHYLYVTVGSNSNIAEGGMDNEENRAAILQVNLSSGNVQTFASGLRNPNGLAWNPSSGELWTTVNERDGIGSDLVPDYMTAVREGGFYGWPYSYFGSHVDARVEPQQPALVASALKPDYALGAHTASLGLAFNTKSLWPAEYRNGAFIGQHGSWNRRPRSGYQVIFVAFKNGKPVGPPKTVLSGFLSPDDKAWGRPAGVTFAKDGALLVADDAGDTVWRVTPAL